MSLQRGDRFEPIQDFIEAYETLGVSREYLYYQDRHIAKLVLKHHPDRIEGPVQRRTASHTFQAIQQAYELLSDPQRRSQYDNQIRRQRERLYRELSNEQKRYRDEYASGERMSTRSQQPSQHFTSMKSLRIVAARKALNQVEQTREMRIKSGDPTSSMTAPRTPVTSLLPGLWNLGAISTSTGEQSNLPSLLDQHLLTCLTSVAPRPCQLPSLHQRAQRCLEATMPATRDLGPTKLACEAKSSFEKLSADSYQILYKLLGRLSTTVGLGQIASL